MRPVRAWPLAPECCSARRLRERRLVQPKPAARPVQHLPQLKKTYRISDKTVHPPCRRYRRCCRHGWPRAALRRQSGSHRILRKIARRSCFQPGNLYSSRQSLSSLKSQLNGTVVERAPGCTWHHNGCNIRRPRMCAGKSNSCDGWPTAEISSSCAPPRSAASPCRSPRPDRHSSGPSTAHTSDRCFFDASSCWDAADTGN